MTRAGRRIHFCHMSHTITIRLTTELATWLEQTAARSGVSQGKIVREQLERAKDEARDRPFMHLAGVVDGARDLSLRKGFSRS